MGTIPKIAIDAGHGLKTQGKQTPDGIKEWTLNDKVRKQAAKILADYDCTIIYLDNNEGSIDEPLADRLFKYVSAGVDAMISIHHNAYTSTWNDATGVETYTDRNPTSGDVKLANILQKKMVAYTGLRDRGVKQANFYVINTNKVPAAVLVEGGFMDSRNDYKVITSEEGQVAYGRAVAESLIEYLNLKKKSTPTPTPTPASATTSSVKVGDLVQIKSGAKYASVDKTVPSWALSEKWYIDKVNGDKALLGKNEKKNNELTSWLYIKDLTVVSATVSNSSSTTPTPKPSTTTNTYSKTQFIKDVQAAIGAKVDGIAGSETLSKTVTVSKSENTKHKVVLPIQKYLNSLGYNCGKADGIAGTKFDDAVKAYQKANKCVVDGEITAKRNTWKKLLGMM